MPSSNILLFDANKANMMADEQYSTNTQRLNGVQSGIASSQLQNKTLYQVSLVAYAIAQIMNQNGLDANDTAAVSAFVANLSGTMLQKVADLASTQEAQAGVATGKWMSPALVKAAMDTYTSNKWLPLTGGTMQGNLILNTSSPTNALQAASKGYVDSKITNSVPKLLYSSIIQAQKGVSKSVTISNLSNCKIIMGHFIILDGAVSSFTISNNVGIIYEATQSLNQNDGCSLIALQGEKLLTSLSFHGFYFGCENTYSEIVFQYSNEIKMYCRADSGENYRIFFELYKIA